MLHLNFNPIPLRDQISDQNSSNDQRKELESEKKNDHQANHLVKSPNLSYSFSQPHPSSPRKQMTSILEIEQEPYLQASRVAYSYSSKSSPLPFAEWTIELRTQAINKLILLGIPLRKRFLEQLYQCIQNSQEVLCQNPKVTYPALFKAHATDRIEGDESDSCTIFELQIYSNKKISLLFRQIKEEFIERGSAKFVFKAYALSKPKVTAYLISPPTQNTDLIANNEENYFKQLSGRPYIAKVYDIFYYNFTLKNKSSYRQQIIEMKYYPLDLLKAVNSYKYAPKTDQDKMQYSIQFLEAVADLHSRKITHRDIKLENILISAKKKIGLTDFGLATDEKNHHSQLGRAGSLPFATPEILMTKESQYHLELDIWAAACVLWLIWSETPYPWYKEAFEKNPNVRLILQLMVNFQHKQVEENQPLLFLIWNMLRFDKNLRWNAAKALDFLKGLAKNLPQKGSFDLSKQFEAAF